jgi:hypothetical protein
MADDNSITRRDRLKALRETASNAPAGQAKGRGADAESNKPGGGGRILKRLLEARQQRGEGGGENTASGGKLKEIRRRLMEQRRGESGSGLDVNEDSSQEDLAKALEGITDRLSLLEKALERAHANKKKIEEWLAAKR